MCLMPVLQVEKENSSAVLAEEIPQVAYRVPFFWHEIFGCYNAGFSFWDLYR